MDADVLDAYPKMKALFKRIGEHEKMVAYLKDRPKADH